MQDAGADLGVLCEQLKDAIGRVAVPANRNRGNIVAQDGDFQRSLLLGAFTVKGTGVTAATMSGKYDHVLALVHRVARFRSEDIAYSGVMINVDVSTQAHRDLSNITLNDVLILGDFTQGDIVVECSGGHA
eukprot:6214702-Amphidinium_carterae.2